MRYLNITFLLFLSFSSYCATVTWDGGGGDDLWINKLNWDMDEVPKFDDDVIISGSQVKVTDEVYCKSLLMTTSAELQISSNGGIEVKGSLSFGVRVNNSTLIIDGFLTIKDIQEFGLIVNGSTSVIENNGTINIENVNVSESIFTYGLDGRSGTIKNFASGNIYISNVNGYLGSIAGMKLNSLTLMNYGDVSITNCDSRGFVIESAGQLTNSGDILLDSIGFDGIMLSGTFNNTTNGRLILSNIDTKGIRCLISSIFDNMGEVITHSVDNVFNSFGSVTNYGDISLFDGNLGISLVNSDASFINHGRIEIDQFSQGISNQGGFVNEGIIEINNITNLGIRNENIFENKDSIFIQNARIGLQNEGQFINEDSLLIHSSLLHGILNSDTFNLKAGALIEINGVSDPASTALLNENPNSLFSIDGSIAISNASNNGFMVLQGIVFVDNPGNVTTNNITDIKFEVQAGAELTIGHEIDIGN